jgi:hypothetical protein
MTSRSWGEEVKDFVTGLQSTKYFNNNTKASEIKSVIMWGRGVKKFPELRDVIYGRPFT